MPWNARKERMKLDLMEASQEEAWRDRSRPVVQRIVFASGRTNAPSGTSKPAPGTRPSGKSLPSTNPARWS